MPALRFDPDACPSDLRRGLRQLVADRPQQFSGGSDAVEVRFKHWRAPGLRAESRDGVAMVRYGQRNDAFRALGRLLVDAAAPFDEAPLLDTRGVMLDVSRNGVMRVDQVRSLLCHLALLGVNTFLLYTEDTYAVPGEPLFGYLRGAYRKDELRAIDDFAHALGIEMIPCIQTLAHLEQVTQWPEYQDLEDVRGVLLADHDPTYALLERMIHAASAPFRSKRIHLGMDEAQGLGSGRYRQLFGERDPFGIFNRHLQRLRDMCADRGLRPMIWSDMYFRIGSARADYYDRSAVIPPEVAAAIPTDVQLVYWDYYHTDPEFYAEWIDRHRALGHEPVMAGGVWTWGRFWAALPYSMRTADACTRACKASGLREAFVTLWGDDGMECDVFSALPGIAYFAEHAWSEAVDEQSLRDRFAAVCGASFDDFVRASGINSVPDGDLHDTSTNVGKALLWQDPLLAVLDPHVRVLPLRPYFQRLASELRRAARRTPFAGRLAFPAQVAHVLSLKCGLRDLLVAAWRARDAAGLRDVLGRVRTVQRAVKKLWRLHRGLWLDTFKPFGLEVLEHRYGGLWIRLESLADRLVDHLEGRRPEIPELDVDLQIFDEVPLAELGHLTHARVKTPSAIK